MSLLFASVSCDNSGDNGAQTSLETIIETSAETSAETTTETIVETTDETSAHTSEDTESDTTSESLTDTDAVTDTENSTDTEGDIDDNESQTPPASNIKRAIFIGNSYVYYGRTVLTKGSSYSAQSQRENDQGYFYQLCKANGLDVNVTNWCLGSHTLSDFFGGVCTVSSCACKGERHESYITDKYYDYVFVSPGSGTKSAQNIISDFDYIINFFKSANPNVKIVCLANLGAHGYSSSGLDYPDIYNSYSALANKGVIIADWGGLVYRIMNGIYTVPGATQVYNQNSFIVKDGYHPNMLSGYITSLMAYCAITGESAVGQTYAFYNDTTINSKFDAPGYADYYYINGTGDTNFISIFSSVSDMNGIQQLVDKYIADKVYLETIDKS